MAELLEKNFNARLPPSRRLPKYSTDVGKQGEARKRQKSEHSSATLQEEKEEALLSLSDNSPGLFNVQSSNHLSEPQELVLELHTTRDIILDENPARCASQTEVQKGEPVLVSKAVIKLIGNRNAQKVTQGTKAFENNQLYDMSLWRSIALSTWQRFTIACCLHLISSMLFF